MFTSQQHKQELIEKVTSFVKHRDRMMNSHGAHNTLKKKQSITAILNVVNHFKDKNIYVLSKQILLLKADLKNILPGRSSKFFDSDLRKVNDIIDQCNKVILSSNDK